MSVSKKVIAGTMSAALLGGAPAALAQSSSEQGYTKPGGTVQTKLTHSPGTGHQPRATTQVSPPAPPPAAATTSAQSPRKLPFTGLATPLVARAAGRRV